VSKSSRRARDKVVPAAEDFVHSAADRVGPLVHTAADRVGPLAQSAASRVGPLAAAAADILGSAADKISPLAHTAAERLAPLAQSAADRVGPLTHTAADRVSPLAQSAADRLAPWANQAVDRVAPYAHQAADRVSPYAHQAADRLGPIAHQAADRFGPIASSAAERLAPLAGSAKHRGAQVAHDAVERVTDDLLPRLSEALSAAAGASTVVEATKRGQATLAAAKGELKLPEQKKKGRWLKRIAFVAVLGGIAAVIARKFLGSKDADWQAARPTAPYAPPTPPAAPPAAADPAADAVAADAGDDPQGGASAHQENLEANGETVPDQPAEGGDAVEDATVDSAEPAADELSPEARSSTGEQVFAEGATEEVAAEDDATVDASTGLPAAPDGSRYSGEGAYVGDEPPEGFTIKGNERSMKYHVPESSGYARTVAEVWFNSEEAAQAAGFIRAQR
jgi:hypothetical protein